MVRRLIPLLPSGQNVQLLPEKCIFLGGERHVTLTLLSILIVVTSEVDEHLYRLVFSQSFS